MRLMGWFVLILATASFAGEPKQILVFGDSLAAGYGLGKEYAFPALLTQKAGEAGTPATFINGGVSGDTSAGGLRRIGWNLRKPIDILILELGANDGLRGIEPADTLKNLQAIIDKTREKNPDVKLVIAGMTLPPNMGADYIKAFEGVFQKIAERNDAVLIPFLLEGVGGVPELNLPDGIHPTKEGHKIVAETVWRYVSPLLKD